MKYQTFAIKPIGIIHTPFKKKEDCPIQGVYVPDSIGKVIVFPEYEEGLESIDIFSHIMLFYIFDRAGNIKLKRPPFLDDEPRGIFAMRHPCRQNYIGFTIVKLEKIVHNVLEVRGIDVLDGTPLVDIKPYIPKFDFIQEASNGWLANKGFRTKPPGRE